MTAQLADWVIDTLTDGDLHLRDQAPGGRDSRYPSWRSEYAVTPDGALVRAGEQS